MTDIWVVYIHSEDYYHWYDVVGIFETLEGATNAKYKARELGVYGEVLVKSMPLNQLWLNGVSEHGNHFHDISSHEFNERPK